MKDIYQASVLDIMPEPLTSDKGVQVQGMTTDAVLEEFVKKSIPVLDIWGQLSRNEITNNILLDLLAWQFNLKLYSTTFPIETKLRLIQNAIQDASRIGTKWVIEKIVKDIWTDCKITEATEYNGRPFTFRVELYGAENITSEEEQQIYNAIEVFKNCRSWLDNIVVHRNYNQYIYINTASIEYVEMTIGPVLNQPVEGDN